MKSLKLTHYFAIILGTVLSSIIGYYTYYYSTNITASVLITAVFAIILSQLFELAITQFRQANSGGVHYQFATVTEQGMQQLQSKISANITDAQLYVLHWPSHNYVTLNKGTVFAAKHSLVYASRRFHQIVHISDQDYFAQLPEVVALDIQSLLKQLGYTTVIPLGSGDEVCGFVFTNTVDLSNESVESLKHSGVTLHHLLQHDAMVMGAQQQSTDCPSPDAAPWQSLVVLGAFFLLSGWWLITPMVKQYLSMPTLFEFGNLYGLVSVWGGIWGLIIARQFKKQINLRRAFTFFSVGLLLQEWGQISYAIYYMFWEVQIPYPSVGDIGFFGSALTYVIGVFFLAKASGVNLKLNNFKNQLLAILVPCAILLIGYLLFLQNYQFDWGQPLKIFLDFAYPFVQAVYVSIAILIYLFSDTEGQLKRNVFFILLALIWQFFCDYTFLFQASRGTWEVNGVNDYMYCISYVMMTLAVLRFMQPWSMKHSAKFF